MTGAMMGRVVDFAEEVRFARVLRNPLDYFAIRIGGARRTLRFDDGFAIDLGRATRQVALGLAGLAYSGAHFTRGAAEEPDLWSVSDTTITTPSGIRFTLDSLNPTIFAETFIYDIHHGPDDVRDRLVVDVGANVGDSSLYFAQRGARVHAYEPDPDNFQRLLRNLDLNPALKERVQPINHAVGPAGTVRFHAGLGGASGMHERGGREIDVPSDDLRTVLGLVPGGVADLFKCDCKGCEFTIVQQPEIRKFARVAIEYNGNLGLGSLADLRRTLEQNGFSRFRVFKHNPLPFRVSSSGVLEAS